MESLSQDLRYALRSLAKAPGFTLLTVIILALGIGANSAIFSVVNAVLLHPLPFADPDRLIVVRETWADGGIGSVSGPDFLDWQERNRVFTGMSASRSLTLSLLEGGEPEEYPAGAVSAGFFQVLGVTSILGRGFVPGEDQGQPTVVVLGEEIWRTRFNADPGILGRAVTLGGRPYTVVGVVPREVSYPGRSQLWIPLGFGLGHTRERDDYTYNVVARLKPGETIERAYAALTVIARALEAEYPATNTGRGVLTVPLGADTVRGVRPVLLVLSAAVVAVLLIACANVANLFLARAAVRQREVAVRAALGAGRWRLARQALVEAVVVAVMGGALGLLLASWSVDLLMAIRPRGVPNPQAAINGVVLGFTLAISLLVGVSFGVVPALSMAAQDPAESFRGEGRGTSSGRRSSRFRAGLVVAQISLALVLVVGAALLILTVRRLTTLDAGFRADNAVTFYISIPAAKYADAAAQRGFVKRIIEQLGSIPGTRNAGSVFFLPLGNGQSNGDVSVEGEPPARRGWERTAEYRMVSGDYAGAIGLQLRQGRNLGPQDIEGAPLAVVVNQAFAREFFGGRNPIGKRVTLGQPDAKAEWREIVGVVGDVRHTRLTVEPGPELYVPIEQLSPDIWSVYLPLPVGFVLRNDRPFEALAAEIKHAVHQVDPAQPVSRMRPANELIADAVARQRFGMILLAVFGGLALTLAAVGVYGVMAYSVSQRTRELGIRLALGARASSVRALVLRQGLGMALAGVAIGLLAALALGRLVSSLLYDVSPSDPRVLALVAALLSAVSLMASLVPAVRATRVDPIEALRSE